MSKINFSRNQSLFCRPRGPFVIVVILIDHTHSKQQSQLYVYPFHHPRHLWHIFLYLFLFYPFLPNNFDIIFFLFFSSFSYFSFLHIKLSHHLSSPYPRLIVAFMETLTFLKEMLRRNFSRNWYLFWCPICPF